MSEIKHFWVKVHVGPWMGWSLMSHVKFKKWSCGMSLSYSCRMSPLRFCHVAYRILEMPYVVSLFFLAMSISPMSHDDFKNWLCCHVKFRGQGPYTYLKRNSTKLTFILLDKSLIPSLTLLLGLWCPCPLEGG